MYNTFTGLLSAFTMIAISSSPLQAHSHGLWLWKSSEVFSQAQDAIDLREFCKAQGIDEVYISIGAGSSILKKETLVDVIPVLHKANIRVEALLSSTDADLPGKPRETVIGTVQDVVAFNKRHPQAQFDGIHLDIEPQQRPENKGTGNLRFLPGLVETFKAVRQEAGKLSVNADIQNKLLKGSLDERRMLLTALPRLTLMMYELNTPNDSAQEMAEKVRSSSLKFLRMAYDGLGGTNVASMAIALRTPDYLDRLSSMLQVIDDTNRGNQHYLGWARHSYNDYLESR